MSKGKIHPFVRDFFSAGGKHPTSEISQRHFARAFVSPVGFEALLDDLRPVQGQRKIVVVDGHPRSGKTWCVLRALQQIIEEQGIVEGEWWTAGMDSMAVFSDGLSDLHSGSKAVLAALEENRTRSRLIFLDDFLGTNQLREMGASFLDRSVRPFLTWDENNPWMFHLAEGGTLVITGRSLHVTLVEMLLGINLRPPVSQRANITVSNPRRGLFRTFDRNDLYGAFNSTLLETVCELNVKYHPLPHKTAEQQRWFVMAAPILAFGHPRGIQMTNPTKRCAARILFGEDLDSLAHLLGRTMSIDNSLDKSSTSTNVLNDLLESYLVAIAPGLLFLDRAAYNSLGIAQQHAIDRIAVQGLYLYESNAAFTCGRLPNEFYMTAIHDHLGTHLSEAATAFARLALRGNLNPPPKELGLGLRGILERNLRTSDVATLPLQDDSEFATLLRIYQESYADALLSLEAGNFDDYSDLPSSLSPGLAAAIGCVGKFPEQFGPKKLDTVILVWFPRRFRELAKHGTELAGQGDIIVVDDLIAVFSVFLQWVFELVRRDPSNGVALLNGYLNIFEDLAEDFPELTNRLKIVIEDQCAWARIEELGHPEVLERRLQFLSGDALSRCGNASEAYCLANRFFSLAWHNEWMEKDELTIATKAARWIDNVAEQALEIIEREPHLVADNLQYHWCHFITQRAAWMRDWVFHDDPIQFEREYSKVAYGCKSEKYNEHFAMIARAVIHHAQSDPRSVRNVTLLLGTRAKRIPLLGELTGMLDSLMADEKRSGTISVEVLMAIFELGRQGFLEAWSDNVTDEFRQWCKTVVEASHSVAEQAWVPYYKELGRVTHLDLLPNKYRGWPGVLPKEWGLNVADVGGAL